jgi:hypothetical protein
MDLRQRSSANPPFYYAPIDPGDIVALAVFSTSDSGKSISGQCFPWTTISGKHRDSNNQKEENDEGRSLSGQP